MTKRLKAKGSQGDLGKEDLKDAMTTIKTNVGKYVSESTKIKGNV